jgi:hypothetical protein
LVERLAIGFQLGKRMSCRIQPGKYEKTQTCCTVRLGAIYDFHTRGDTAMGLDEQINEIGRMVAATEQQKLTATTKRDRDQADAILKMLKTELRQLQRVKTKFTPEEYAAIKERTEMFLRPKSG